MNVLEILIVIVIFCALIAILSLIFYNRFEELTVYINEAEMNIDDTLRKKFDLLSRLINVINGNIEQTDNKFDSFVKLKGKKMSNHEMDRKLVECVSQFYLISDEYKELKSIKNYQKMLKELEENEEKLVAAKAYYNDNITMYNKLVKLFPSNIIAIFLKKEQKPFFDGKNLFDEVYNDFQV